MYTSIYGALYLLSQGQKERKRELCALRTALIGSIDPRAYSCLFEFGLAVQVVWAFVWPSVRNGSCLGLHGIYIAS